MNQTEKFAISKQFRCGLFAMREIVESAPVRVVNWRMVRILAGITCTFWFLAIVAILGAHWLGQGHDAVLFALGLPFAVATFAFRAFDALKVVRRPPPSACSFVTSAECRSKA